MPSNTGARFWYVPVAVGARLDLTDRARTSRDVRRRERHASIVDVCARGLATGAPLLPPVLGVALAPPVLHASLERLEEGGAVAVEYDAYLRVYPLGGGFFLGAGIGYESVRGTFTRTVSIPDVPGVITAQTVSVESEASVRSLVLTPQIGYFHTFGSGFSLGVDV